MKWKEHLQRTDGTRISKQATNYKIHGRRDIGPTRKIWSDLYPINEIRTGSCLVLGLKKNKTYDAFVSCKSEDIRISGSQEHRFLPVLIPSTFSSSLT
jgi:hypothetical protein